MADGQREKHLNQLCVFSDNRAKERDRICPLSPEQDIKQHIVPFIMLLQLCSSQSQPSRAPAEALGHLKNYPPWLCNPGVICITANYCPTIPFRLFTVTLCTHTASHVTIGPYLLDLNHPSACLHLCNTCAEAHQKAGFPMISQGTGYFSIPGLLVLQIPYFRGFTPLI